MHVLGFSLCFKGVLGKPIQIAHKGGVFSIPGEAPAAAGFLSLGLQDEALREREVLLHCLHL